MQVRKRKRIINQRIMATAVYQYDYCKTRIKALRFYFSLRLTAREAGRAYRLTNSFIRAVNGPQP